MELKAKRYVKILFTLLFTLILVAIVYVYYFNKHYPAPITNRISFDAKLKFIRDNINPNDIDTIIVGSSIGMNNVIGSILEKNSKVVKHALNLSVYEATALEAQQILELSSAFPNLKRIIYSAQYSDFPHPYTYKNYDSSKLRRYIRHELSTVTYLKLIFKACNNLLFCYERANKWNREHQDPTKFTSLIFDHTASVPLKIYRGAKVGARWYAPHPGIMHPKSFEALYEMAKDAKAKGVKFYLAHQPYRPELYKKYKSVRDAIDYFDKKATQALKDNGKLIKLQSVPLKDSDFADRTHLNDKGSLIITKEIAKFIDKEELK